MGSRKVDYEETETDYLGTAKLESLDINSPIVQYHPRHCEQRRDLHGGVGFMQSMSMSQWLPLCSKEYTCRPQVTILNYDR